MITVGLLQPPSGAGRLARHGTAVAGDLGLDELYAAMALGDKFIGQVVKAVVPASLTDVDVIRYRQSVLGDFLTTPDMLHDLFALATEAVAVRRWGSGRGGTPRVKLGLARQPLEELAVYLRKLRQTCEKYAGACTSDGLTRLCAALTDLLDEQYLVTLSEHLESLDFADYGIMFSATLGAGNKPYRVMLHEPPKEVKRTLFGSRRDGTAFEATSDFELPNDPLMAVIEPPLDAVAEVVSRATDNVQEFFRSLRAELAFYLGCLNLHDRLRRAGVPICFPEPAVGGGPVLRAEELRDTSLCLSSNTVVGNSIDAVGHTLLVVTGANSGGKSTFLRSVGVAQLMMQAGMFVTAGAFTADVREGVFTHFVQPEDPSMTHGRLDEELARVREITDELRAGAMVLFNEPFASTNDQEAGAIADPIVTALLDSGVKVLIVTHLYDFVRRRYDAGYRSDIFLRAERAPDGRRTYRLAVGAPEATSHGQDIFARIFGYRFGVTGES